MIMTRKSRNSRKTHFSGRLFLPQIFRDTFYTTDFQRHFLYHKFSEKLFIPQIFRETSSTTGFQRDVFYHRFSGRLYLPQIFRETSSTTGFQRDFFYHRFSERLRLPHIFRELFFIYHKFHKKMSGIGKEYEETNMRLKAFAAVDVLDPDRTMTSGKNPKTSIHQKITC